MCYEGSFQQEHDLACGHTPHRWTLELIERAVQQMREAFRDGFALVAAGKIDEVFDGPLRHVEDELDDLPQTFTDDERKMTLTGLRDTWRYYLRGLQGDDPQGFVDGSRNSDGSLPTFEGVW